MYATLKSFADIAPIFSMLGIFLGVFVARRQLKLSRLSQRETTAKSTWREYLKLAFECPKLAAGGPINSMSTDELRKYRWFVAHLLWAVEEVMFFARKDQIWRENIRLQMLNHRDYFRRDEAFQRALGGYSKDVRDLVQQAKTTA